jgi:membrane protein
MWRRNGKERSLRPRRFVDMSGRRLKDRAWLAVSAVLAAASILQSRRCPDEAPEHPFNQKTSLDEPLAVHLARAAERGRGRKALYPWQIPWRGWRDILWRTYAQFNEDRLLAVAGGVVFFVLLALFPGISAFVSLYGLFADRATLADHLGLIAAIAPAEAYGIIRDQIDRVMKTSNDSLGLTFLLSFGLSLWSANAGMKAVMDALNVAYEEKEERSIIRLNMESLLFTLGCFIGLLLAITAVVVLPLVMERMGLSAITETLIFYLRWPALVLLLITFLSTLYRFGPSRRHAKWTWLTPGSFVASLLWLAGSFLLSWYLENVANYNAVYGTLGAAVGLMMWLWLTAIAVLFGAEINAEIEHQTAQDTTIGPPKPLGVRGATMADTVGQAAE